MKKKNKGMELKKEIEKKQKRKGEMRRGRKKIRKFNLR